MRGLEDSRLLSLPVVVFLLLAAIGCSGPGSFEGTALDPADAAPPFRLHDQFGAAAGLSDWSGKVVVLTFLYTYCPDICPIVTETLRRTHQLLGTDARQLEMVAISVDPQRDSVERAFQYSQEKDMLHKWRFLVGSEEELAPIWWSYWLDPVTSVSVPQDSPHDDSQGEGAFGTGPDAPSGLSPGLSSGGYLVSHNAPVFLIDRYGHRRVLFLNPSLDPEPLVHDIRLLLKESSSK